MGADIFHVCYGHRWVMDASNQDEVTLLEKREHPRQLVAKIHQLDSWWGVTTDENRYFLLVGKLIGRFGWEGEHSARIEEAELSSIVEETTRKLREAEFEGVPAWHFQFEPDY